MNEEDGGGYGEGVSDKERIYKKERSRRKRKKSVIERREKWEGRMKIGKSKIKIIKEVKKNKSRKGKRKWMGEGKRESENGQWWIERVNKEIA